MLSDGYVISLKSVMLRYANGKKAIKGADLNLCAPSFQYLTGISGAGKTSVLKLIGLEATPTAGSIFLFGKDIAETTDEERCILKQQIGFISQGFDLINSMTVLDNVALPLKVAGVNRKERERQAMEILDWFHVSNPSDIYPFELSSGERQCVAIARAIIHKPKILLADDPVCYLDNRAAKRVVTLFYEMSKIDTCVIITNNNDHRTPYFVKEAREIKMLEGNLIDNVLSRPLSSEFPIAI